GSSFGRLDERVDSELSKVGGGVDETLPLPRALLGVGPIATRADAVERDHCTHRDSCPPGNQGWDPCECGLRLRRAVVGDKYFLIAVASERSAQTDCGMLDGVLEFPETGVGCAIAEAARAHAGTGTRPSASAPSGEGLSTTVSEGAFERIQVRSLGVKP